MFSLFGLSLSPRSLRGDLLRRCVGRTTERRKPGRLSRRPGRRRVLDRSRGSFVVGFVAQRKMSTDRRCSLSTEAQAAGDAQDEEEYVRLVMVHLLFQDANMWERKRADRTLARSIGYGLPSVVCRCLPERIKCTRLVRQAVST